MLSQYPPLAANPVLSRQYLLFTGARDRANDPDCIKLWSDKIDAIINRAFALDQIKERTKDV